MSFVLAISIIFTLFSGFTNTSTSGDDLSVSLENIETIDNESLSEPFIIEEATVEYLEADAFPAVLEKSEIQEKQYVGRVKGEETNEYTLVLKNADGSNTLRLFDYPVKYTDEEGTEKDITLKLTETAKGNYRTVDNKIITTFSQKLSDGISLEYEDVAIKMVPEEQPISSVTPITPITPVMDTNDAETISATEIIGPITELTPITPVREASLSDDKETVSYPFGNKTSLEYSLTYTGFKEDIVVEEYTGQTEYTFRLYTNGLTLIQEYGSYYLADENNEIKATIGDIIIFTADERNNAFGSMTYETVTANEEYLMTIHVDADYLKDEKTVYPIRIDPTLEINYDNDDEGNAIEDVTINSSAGSSGSSGSLMIGKRETYGISRVLMKFPGLDVTTFASTNQITSATVEIRDIMCESEELEIYCYIFNGNQWDESTASWSTVNPNAYVLWQDRHTISYAYGVNQSTRHRYSFDITQAVQKWKDDTYSQSKGILFKALSPVENGSAYIHKTFASYNRASNKPSLSITYNPAISLSASSVILSLNNTCTLTATTYPVMNVSWSSNDSSIVTINNNGNLRAVRYGKATITARCTDANGNTYSAYCQVYVNIPNGVYRIKSNYNNQYLTVENAGITNYTDVFLDGILTEEPDYLTQLWKIYYIGTGYYSIRPMHKLDMGLYGEMTGDVNITNLGLTDSVSNITPYGRWYITGTENEFFFRREGQSAATLAVDLSSANNPNICVQSFANNHTNQMWSLYRVTDTSITEGVILHDIRRGEMVTEITKYILPGETVELSDWGLVASAYSQYTINQSLTWDEYSSNLLSVNSSSGEVTANALGVTSVVGGKSLYNSPLVTINLHVIPIYNGTYYLKNLGSNKYTDILDSVSNGALIGHTQSQATNAARWVFTYSSNGYYTIRLANVNEPYYLGVKDDSTALGTSIVLRNGTITDGMKWKISITSSGAYKLVPKSGESIGRTLSINAPSGAVVWQTQYQDDLNYADEWWISTQPKHHAFVFNYYDNGYLVRYGESEDQAVEKINGYTEAVSKRFDEIFDLIIINPSATYYNSAMDQCKGTVTSTNIDTLCQELVSHTNRNNVVSDFKFHKVGNMRITNVLWTGHRITSTDASGDPEENRSCSSGTGVFMLNLLGETYRERDSIGILMHELCHQYDGIDHYHEEDENEACIRPDICSGCNKTTGRPGTCVMNNSRQDIFADAILCEDCEAEIRTHLDGHH